MSVSLFRERQSSIGSFGAGEPKAGLAREFGISRQTLYQYLSTQHRHSRPCHPADPVGPGWRAGCTLLTSPTTTYSLPQNASLSVGVEPQLSSP